MTTLQGAAQAAGLQDMALLKEARFDVDPAAAVADLRTRFPSAFPPPTRMYADMTEAERKDFHKRNGLPMSRAGSR